MSGLPSESKKFLAVRGAVGKVVALVCESFSLSSDSSASKKIREAGTRTLTLGLHTLAQLSRNEMIATPILEAKKDGNDVITVARSVLARAQWACELPFELQPPEVSAVMFFRDIGDARDPLVSGSKTGYVGQLLASDWNIMKALTQVVELGVEGTSLQTFDISVQTLGFFATLISAELRQHPETCDRAVDVTAMWFKAYLFSALPLALLAPSNSTSSTNSTWAVHYAAAMAVSACNGSRSLAFGRKLGRAPIDALTDAGYSSLLSRPYSGSCNIGLPGMVSSLKTEFLYPKSGLTHSWLGNQVYDFKKREVVTLDPSGKNPTGLEHFPSMSTSMTFDWSRPGIEAFMPRFTFDFNMGGFPSIDSSKLGSACSSSDHVQKYLTESKGGEDRQRWVCSAPDCSSIDAQKRCKCGIAHYCSRDCQKKDWTVHKLVCALRKK